MPPSHVFCAGENGLKSEWFQFKTGGRRVRWIPNRVIAAARNDIQLHWAAAGMRAAARVEGCRVPEQRAVDIYAGSLIPNEPATSRAATSRA